MRSDEIVVALESAREAYRRHHDAEAEGHLRAALELRPDAAGVRLALAATLVRQRRDDEARRELAAASERESRLAVRLRATLALRAGRSEQAAALFASVGDKVGLGVVAASRGDLRVALALLDEAAREQPRSALVRHDRALVLERLGQAARAADEARLAVALDPYFPAARVGLAGALHAAGRPEEAAQELAAAATRFPAYAPARANLGALLLVLGEPASAVTELDAAAALAPELPEVPFNLGLAWFRLGDLARARAAFARVLELDPAHAAARRNLRWLDGRRAGQLVGDELPAVVVNGVRQEAPAL